MDNENDQLFSCYRKLYNLREDGKMTLAQLRDVIAGPKLKLKTLEIRRLDAAGEVDKTRKKKLSLPTFAVSFLFPDERYNDQAAEPTGYVLVDIDQLSGPVAGYFEQCKSLPFLALAYVSARGKGLHLICRAETDAATHADVCRALYDLLEATFGEPVDRNCTDLTRTSLLCWDAGCYYNPRPKVFRLAQPPAAGKQSPTATGYLPPSEADRLALYLDRVDARVSWQKGQRHMQLVSLAYSLNRAGFDRLAVAQACISRYAQRDFDDREIGRVIDSVYTKSQAEHGVNRREYTPPARPLSDTNVNRATRESPSGRKTDPADECSDTEEDKSLTPFFDYALLSRAPQLLQDMLRPDLTGRQRDIALAGALVALSTVTPHVTGQYHGHTDAPTLYLYVVASPGFGKGILQEVRKALLVWQQYIRDNSRMRVQKYEEELEAYNHHNTAARKAGKIPILSRPLEVKQMELDIPGTITQAKLTELLKTNEHYPGLMCETEIGILVDATGQEYGKYIYLLNQIAQHETIGRGSLQNSVLSCDFPRMSLLTSGTFGQFTDLIRGTDDGLFSRFLAYTIDEAPEWKDLTDIDDDPHTGSYYPALGERIKLTGIFLDEHETFVCYTDAQRKRLNRRFSAMSKKVRWFKGDDELSVVHRLGNMHFRICMLLTALRKAEAGSEVEKVRVLDVDFDLAMMFVLTFQKHIQALASLLPSGKIRDEFVDSDDYERFYRVLPDSFPTSEAIAVGDSSGVKERTVKRLLKRWSKDGLLVRLSRGNYRKGDCRLDD